ncbi:MAG: patatin-like phospholipase family protein, partial [Treponema sp.]|nr:patatin-like phospholipase family protein [Treponema sp.]
MRKILAVFLLCLFLVPARAEDERPSVALVLGGGAARGFAHIAVLELIEEMGIPIDMIAGVSSGAIVGGLYSAGYSPKMIMDAMEFRNWTSFFQDRPLPPYFNTNNNLPLGISIGGSAEGISPNWGRGYSSGQRVYELFKSLTVKIPSYMDFDELPIPFRAGAVEIPGGQFRFLKEGDLAEAIRASMSIQGVFEPFIIDGQSYTDGGLMNNVPIKLVREMGYDIVIAVDLFALPDEFSTAPLDLPDLLTTLYSSQTSRDQHGLADVVLFPLPSNVSATSFEKGREIYTLAKDKRDILASQLEPVLKMINEAASNETAPLNSEKKYAHTYENLPPIIPGEIFIKGELPRDRSLIKREYKKILKDNALGEKNVAAFLGKIYETGNYRMVTLRVQKLP